MANFIAYNDDRGFSSVVVEFSSMVDNSDQSIILE